MNHHPFFSEQGTLAELKRPTGNGKSYRNAKETTFLKCGCCGSRITLEPYRVPKFSCVCRDREKCELCGRCSVHCWCTCA